MSRNGYTFLGWVVWQLGSRLAKHQLKQNQAKIGAAGVVLLVLVGGIVAAKSGSDD